MQNMSQDELYCKMTHNINLAVKHSHCSLWDSNGSSIVQLIRFPVQMNPEYDREGNNGEQFGHLTVSDNVAVLYSDESGYISGNMNRNDSIAQ